MSTSDKPCRPLSPAQARALKKKLRSLGWQTDAVLREISLLQKLRKFIGGA